MGNGWRDAGGGIAERERLGNQAGRGRPRSRWHDEETCWRMQGRVYPGETSSTMTEPRPSRRCLRTRETKDMATIEVHTHCSQTQQYKQSTNRVLGHGEHAQCLHVLASPFLSLDPSTPAGCAARDARTRRFSPRVQSESPAAPATATSSTVQVCPPLTSAATASTASSASSQAIQPRNHGSGSPAASHLPRSRSHPRRRC